MKTRSEEDHYVRLLAASIFDLLVGDFVKGQWGDALPDFKGPSNGLIRVILSNLGSVILDTMGTKRGQEENTASNISFKQDTPLCSSIKLTKEKNTANRAVEPKTVCV